MNRTMDKFSLNSCGHHHYPDRCQLRITARPAECPAPSLSRLPPTPTTLHFPSLTPSVHPPLPPLAQLSAAAVATWGKITLCPRQCCHRPPAASPLSCPLPPPAATNQLTSPSDTPANDGCSKKAPPPTSLAAGRRSGGKTGR